MMYMLQAVGCLLIERIPSRKRLVSPRQETMVTHHYFVKVLPNEVQGLLP